MLAYLAAPVPGRGERPHIRWQRDLQAARWLQRNPRSSLPPEGRTPRTAGAASSSRHILSTSAPSERSPHSASADRRPFRNQDPKDPEFEDSTSEDHHHQRFSNVSSTIQYRFQDRFQDRFQYRFQYIHSVRRGRFGRTGPQRSRQRREPPFLECPSMLVASVGRLVRRSSAPERSPQE